MGLLEELKIDEKDYNEIPEQTAGGNLWEPGVYDVIVDKAYIRKTESGAKMLEVDLLGEDGSKMHYSTCTHAGDLKKNKETFGIHAMKHFLEAIGTPNPDVSVATVKHKDANIEALAMTNVQGKKLKVGVIEVEGEFNGNQYVKNSISAFMDKNGKNSKGSEIAEDVAARILRNPRKIEKSKAQKDAAAAMTTNDDKKALAGSGWGGAAS
jgi:hypothetical protein